MMMMTTMMMMLMLMMIGQVVPVNTYLGPWIEWILSLLHLVPHLLDSCSGGCWLGQAIALVRLFLILQSQTNQWWQTDADMYLYLHNILAADFTNKTSILCFHLQMLSYNSDYSLLKLIVFNVTLLKEFDAMTIWPHFFNYDYRKYLSIAFTYIHVLHCCCMTLQFSLTTF
jgi:hypothetical protein